jgi:DsbC/DsbD-like thiol-disulfide interchange protein
MRTLFGCVLAVAAAGPAAAQNPAWFDKAVQKVEASFAPAEAKPGQTVTLRVTVHLHDGFHTYPLVQPDKGAAGMVNKLTFADNPAVVFVGTPRDPKDFQSKAEPDLGIAELRYLPGKVVYERTAVVSPKAAAGPVTVKPTLRLSVCDKDNCFPAKAVTPEATLKVLDGPAVEVAPEYRDEVTKATGGV